MAIPKYYVRPDGLHETIIRINGKRKAFRGKTDREVWNKVKAYKDDLSAGKTVSFKDVAEKWWNEIEPTLAPNSLKNYTPAYNRAVAEFGEMDVASVKAKDVENYVNQFAKTRAKKTVATQRQVIRQILNKAQREGYIEYNPADAVLLPKNLPQKKRHAPSRAQIQLIKDSVNDKFGLFPFVVYYTGLRRGEVRGLRYEDIDRKKKRISVNRNVYDIGSTPHTKDPKTDAGVRSVPLLDELAAILPNKRRGYIFSEDGGVTPMSDRRVQKFYKAYQRETGVTSTLHEIRHGYASALYAAGLDIKMIQELLGHAQLSTTMDIYTDIFEDRVDTVATQLAGRM